MLAPIVNGPHAGTFAKIGAAVVITIGATQYKRQEIDGKWVWILRPSLCLHRPTLEWDQRSPFVRTFIKPTTLSRP